MSGIPERDGLQQERTALAWQRTALLTTLISVPVMVLGARLADRVAAVLGATAAIAGVVLSDAERARVRQLVSDAPLGPRWSLLVAVTVVILVAATAAVLVALRVLTR